MASRVYLTILIACLVAKSTSVCSSGSEGCFPLTVNVAKMFEATSTCGDPPSLYCPPDDATSCLVCNQTSGENTHPEAFAIDRDFATAWQSSTAPDRLIQNVNVSVNFTARLQLEKSVLTFETYRPEAMILEKSDDFGATWTPVQYYASSCDSSFSAIDDKNRDDLPNENMNTNAFCIEQDSTPLDPPSGGTVTYDVAHRYGSNRFDLVPIVDFTLVTNLRARFVDLTTFNDELVGTPPPETFAKYYYGIQEWTVDARCYCYGHSNECVTDGGMLTGACKCDHNTDGPNCDRCLPLFNNKPFMRGNSTHANPCEKCECYDHSDSCVYDDTKGFGVCQNCQHNTTGDMCEQCLPDFFRDPTKNLNDPDVCIACQCNSVGATGAQCDSSGVCSCKINVEGDKCNRCKAGFFDLSVSNGNDSCRACGCHNGGSDPTNGGQCNAVTGQCGCKSNVVGLQCDTCKPGFYGLDASSVEGCPKACGCSLSTSTSTICDPVTGQCPCRRGLTGRDCSTIENDRFLPYLEGTVYEAEKAVLGGAASLSIRSETYPAIFTGTGGVLLKTGGDSVTFDIAVPPRTIRYSLVIRYQSRANATLSIRSGDGLNATLLEISVAQKAGAARQNLSYLTGGTRLRVAIANADSVESFIDSVVLFPEKNDILAYADLPCEEQNTTSFCYADREGPVNLISEDLTDTCRNHTILANAWLFNGTLDCNCSQGSLGACEALGGQCSCHSSVRGRTCSDCAYNFFGFSNGLCEACNCSQLGSLSDECDVTTGQCLCRPLTTGPKCDSCVANYYNLSDCQECKCDTTYSKSSQCSEEGICTCKPGIGGPKCSGGCLLGFFNLTENGCIDCGCNPSRSTGCDLASGQCFCHSNWVGFKCENCSDGHFDPAGGCHECFCFEQSFSCQSAEGYELESVVSKSNFQPDLDGWKSVGGGFLLVELYYSQSLLALPQVVIKSTGNVNYFAAPAKFTGNQRLAYFQNLNFDLGLYGGNSPVYTGDLNGDVIIKGVDMQHPIATTISPPPQRDVFQTYSIQLVESNFRLGNVSGRQVTIKEMYQTLENVEYLHIRSNYYQPPIFSETMLDNIELYRAVYTGNASAVTSVEQCACPVGYEGLSCETCQSGYTKITSHGNGFDQCILCQCNGHSSECDPNTGACLNCLHNTTGDDCDQCLLGYFGNATENGCQACPCLAAGSSVSTSCSMGPGGSLLCQSCAEGYTGALCDVCADGYFGSPKAPGGSCQQCECSNRSRSCDSVTGACTCLDGFAGPTCHECESGFFDFSSGCLSCFCFGHASVCRSANGFETSAILSDFDDFSPNGWQGLDASGMLLNNLMVTAVVRNGDITTVLAPISAFPPTEYFRLPQKFLSNKKLAHRQEFSFKLALDGGVAATTSSPAGDVVIKGTLVDQPVVASLNRIPLQSPMFTTYSISIDASSFTVANTSGRNPTTLEMLNILSDIEYIDIRANYFQAGSIGGRAFLDDVTLHVAAFTGAVSNLTNIENCTCDDGYTGLSCDECADGFKRAFANGTAEQVCVPCQCNGHSNQCDALTGVCVNCGHNTIGDFCGTCETGFYGNATQGNVDDCKPCPCPLESPPNQFSPTCYLDPADGGPVCDACPNGYAGRRCDVCDDGYFGQPNVVGSSCQLCDCSDNVDLSQMGNCNATTGRCLKCVNNTAGFFCEKCAEGYFGNALTDSCQQCGCHPSGSVNGSCDQTTGRCYCHPNVVGDKCDQCAPLHFNFQSGVGCSPCDCDPLGSYNSTCDLLTGQCHCKSNVDSTSRTCSSCQDAFFNLTSTGCQECICNETNTISGSKSCHETTGQCQCVSGVSGTSCSNCEAGFFGSPPNCYNCGPCYSNWTTIIRDLLAKIQDQDARVKNFVSTLYGSQTIDELASNITALRDLLVTIVANFSDDTALLSAEVKSLAERLTEIDVEFGAHATTLDGIKAKLDEAETKLNDNAAFNGTVEVASGIYRNSAQLTSEATQLNDSAAGVLSQAQASASEIVEKHGEISASEVESRLAEQLVKAGLKQAEKARNDTEAARSSETAFTVVHANNSGRLSALETQRDGLNMTLQDYLSRGSKAVEEALGANETATNANVQAQAKESSAAREKTSADELLQNVTASLESAESLYNESVELNSTSFQAKSMANAVATDISDALMRLDGVESSLRATRETANMTLMLTAPPVSAVENVSRAINQTIVPESEINATIDQSRESKEKALNVLADAQKASNLSAQASSLVQTIEGDLDNATAAHSRVSVTLDDVEFEKDAVDIGLAKILSDASDAKDTSAKAEVIAIETQKGVDRVRTCRNDALPVLRQAEAKATNACMVTAPTASSGAQSVVRDAGAVNDSQAAAAAAADAATANSLETTAENLQASAANKTQIQVLKELLDEFVAQRKLMEEQRTKAAEYEKKTSDLLEQISTQCPN